MTAKAASSGGQASPNTRPEPRRRLKLDKTPYSWQFGALAVLMLLAAAAQWLLDGPLAGREQAPLLMVGAALALLAVLVWLAGKPLYHYLAGAKSAVLLLTAVMLLTAIGTVVLQGISEAEFTRRYDSFAAPLLWLGFDDVFHSYPFTMLLAMLGVTSTVTVIRRRKTLLRWRHFGLLLTHLSVVALLIGAAIGTAIGSKGMLHLEVGRSGDGYMPDVKADAPPKPRVELGFDVRLDGFKLDNYNPEYKVYTYDSDGADDYRMVTSDAPKVGEKVGAPAPGADIEVTVKRVFKRARQTGFWVTASTPAERAGKPGPAAQLQLHQGERIVASGWLNDTEKVLREPKGRFEVRLAWTAPDSAALSRMALPSKHPEFEIMLSGGESVGVKPGESTELPDGRLVQVRQFLPDFVFDNQTGRAVSRSQQLKNPALVVAVSDPRTGNAAPKTFYLFAKEEIRKMMEASTHGRTDLIFRHRPDAAAVQRSIVVVGSTAERIVVEAGKVVEREPVVWGEAFAPWPEQGDLKLTLARPVPSAVPRHGWQEAAEGPENPAVEVQVNRGGERATFVLPVKGSRPIPLGGRRLLVYREKPNKVRNFESTISILEGGRPVLTQLMKVNHPISYKGYDFYQSNYDPKNPRYSGLQVVHDPGLLLVNIAFWVLMYGVLHTVMMRRWTPWWERGGRRRRSAGRTSPPASPTPGAEAAA